MRSLLALLVIPVGVFAQTPPAPGAPLEFPADATVPTEGELRALLSGKVMRGKPHAATPWRIEYKENGYAFLNVGNFADSGKWRVEGSRLCSEWKQANSGCAEARIKGPTIYFKRGNGEVVPLTPD